PDVDVAQLVSDAIARASATAAERGITIVSHVAADVPSIVADADALRSAFQNVIDNAVKYSREGGAVDVHVDAVTVRVPWNTGVRVRVVDRGVGIDTADVTHVIEPFFRGRRAIDAQVRGSGIGLSVVQHVVAA